MVNTLSHGNEFDLQENEGASNTHFHNHERLCTRNRFETEAKGNSEMAY